MHYYFDNDSPPFPLIKGGKGGSDLWQDHAQLELGEII